MSDLYRSEIIDHYRNPRNFGELKNANIRARVANVSCGDVIEMGVNLRKGKIKEIKFKGEGCALSIAAASMLTELLKGRDIKEFVNLSEEQMFSLFGGEITSGRVKCVLLPLEAWGRIVEKSSCHFIP